MHKMSQERHDRVVWLLYKCIIGALSSEEHEELEQWRKEDPSHERTYQRLTHVRFLEQEFRRLKLVDAECPMQDMRARIRRHAASSRRSMVRRAAIWATAALVAVVCGIGYFGRTLWPAGSGDAEVAGIPSLPPGKTQVVFTRAGGKPVVLDGDSARNARIMARRPQPGGQGRLAQLNKLATPRGGEFRVMLEDSTEVWLNAESQLVYPETFAGDERRVAVSGEAYFKVAKDSLRPFYVETGGMEVRVYGTEFNIQAYGDDAHVYTTLVKGSIALKPLRGSGGELVLTPGHQAVSRTDDQATFVRPVNAAAVASWHEGRFSFEEQTLGQIMQTLSRWYAFEYEFADPGLESTVFKGSAPRYGDLAEVLSILEKSGGIAFGVKGEKIIITNH